MMYNYNSNTYQTIESQAYKISKSQRYSIVFEFYYKPILPPPLVIISYFLSILIFCVRSFRKCLLYGDESKKSYCFLLNCLGQLQV